MSADQLAIYCPTVGTASETFIKRYVHKLLPGRTVVLTEFTPPPDRPPTWSTNCPTFHITKHSNRIRRASWMVGRRRFSIGLMRLGFGDVSNFLRQHHVSAVMGNWLDASWPFIHLCGRNGIKFFGHAHGCDLSASYKSQSWRYRFSDYSQSEGVIVVNKVMADRMLRVGVPSSKLHLIPYGVECGNSSYEEKISTGGTLRCLAVGRMVNKKAPLVLLEAFRKAVNSSSSMTLDYVGDGPLFNEAKRYVETNGLSKRVKLHGQLPHDAVLELMEQSEILLQHSVVDPETGDEEGLPLVILEAMARGLPVIATHHGGIPEAVSDGKSGFLVKEGDSEEMSRRLRQLEKDRAQCHYMGRCGREIFLQRFTWDLERQNLLKILGFGE